MVLHSAAQDTAGCSAQAGAAGVLRPMPTGVQSRHRASAQGVARRALASVRMTPPGQLLSRQSQRRGAAKAHRGLHLCQAHAEIGAAHPAITQVRANETHQNRRLADSWHRQNVRWNRRTRSRSTSLSAASTRR